MRSAVMTWDGADWRGETTRDEKDATVVFAFLDPEIAREGAAFASLKARFPNAVVAGCSTGGGIAGGEATVGAGHAAVLGFDRVEAQVAEVAIDEAAQSFEAGRRLAEALAGEDLSGVFILSDGARVNGSALVDGLREVLGPHMPLSGGLAGDGADFGETLVGCTGPMRPGAIVAVGFHGPGVRMRMGSFGGWGVFGPRRKITRSADNVLFELDGKSALELYKRYLGDDAANLPGSALLYPLQISPTDGGGESVVRTILGIDEATGAMTFAGDMPEGWTAQLMVGDVEDLIDGAQSAGSAAGSDGPGGFALLVSCIGRRLLLGQRASEEVQAVVRALGGIAHAGFYSYGEISPNGVSGTCALHNQTMTVTVFEAA
jgi:hypothetical protein